MSIKFINSDDALKVIETNEKILVVNYFATWCGACKMLAPILESFSTSQDINVLKVDADMDKENMQIFASKYQIESLPTTLFFRKGSTVPVNKIIGFVPVEVLEAAFKKASAI